MKKFGIITMTWMLVLFSGCASNPALVSAQYVNEDYYSDYDCKRIKKEIRIVTEEINRLSYMQEEIVRKDKMYGWTGACLFWPALLFIKGDGLVAHDLALAKGKQGTLYRLSADKDCD